MIKIVKITLLTTLFGIGLSLNGAPLMAQTYSVGIFPDSLVNIKALDTPTMREHNGRMSMGAEVRDGQGIIISPNGIIATNRHILGEAPQHIYVTLVGGKVFEAKIIQNSQADLALIKINVPYLLSAVALGDSSQVQIGNHVLAFANATTNTTRERNGEVIQVYREADSNKVAILEVNIRLKPGDSGGAILNEQGLLLGLIMANQISDPNKSYAIAVNKIQEEYLKYRGSVLVSSVN